MRQAELNTQRNWDMDWRMPLWKPWDWNNCQDYVDAVRDEYDRLDQSQETESQEKEPCK
jgi:hypothetical protein